MQINTIVQPEKGDLCIVQAKRSPDKVEAFTVAEVKIVEGQTEIILNRRHNIWFSWDKYMNGESWVADCRVILP